MQYRITQYHIMRFIIIFLIRALTASWGRGHVPPSPLPPWSGTGKEFITKVMKRSVRIKAPRLYTFFPCSTQLSAKFILFINNKMPTILLSAL